MILSLELNKFIIELSKLIFGRLFLKLKISKSKKFIFE